jgi:hypothetical protein
MTARSLVSNLEKFTGQNEMTVGNWCHLVDDAFSIEKWSDKEQLVLASQQLAGAAATWYEAARNGKSPPTSWASLKAGLIQRFGGTRSAAVSRLEINRLRWKEGQDLEEHITRFTAIRSRITDATEGELISSFRQTLPPVYLSDSLYREPTTLDEAILYTRSLNASRCHGYHPNPHKTFQQPQQQSNSTGPVPMDLDVQQLVRTLQAFGGRGDSQSPGEGGETRRCYRCGKRGHIARFCRQKQPGGYPNQQRFQQPQSGSTMDTRTRRLAELAYQIEQQQKSPQPRSPIADDFEMSNSGKGPSQ